MTKIKQAREDLTEKYFSHKRAGGISNETFETLVTALEKLEAIDGKALGEALSRSYTDGCIYPSQEDMTLVFKAACAVAEIKGE